MGKKTEELLAALRAHPHVIEARMSGKNRVLIVFPRELGGYSYMTIPAAKGLLARISVVSK